MKVLLNGDIERIENRFPVKGWDIDSEYPPKDGNKEPYKERYDIIILDHLIQQAKANQVSKIIEMYSYALKPGGEIMIIVPSLEWAATEIATKDSPGRLAFLSIYGSNEEPHHCGFTTLWLRMEMERAGFRTLMTTTERYRAIVNGDMEEGMQIVYHGQRLVFSAASAID